MEKYIANHYLQSFLINTSGTINVSLLNLALITFIVVITFAAAYWSNHPIIRFLFQPRGPQAEPYEYQAHFSVRRMLHSLIWSALLAFIWLALWWFIVDKVETSNFILAIWGFMLPLALAMALSASFIYACCAVWQRLFRPHYIFSSETQNFVPLKTEH